MARISAQDKQLHDRLKAAVEKNIVIIHTDFRRLNTPQSPVFNPWEAVGPLLVLLLLALLVMVAVGLVAGTIALVFVVLLYLVALRPWLERRLDRRARVMVLHGPRQLQIVWNHGGVALTMLDQPRIGAVAPVNNWRTFVKRHLPDTGHEPLAEDLAGPDFDAATPPDRRAP